jgi:4-hydroxy-tetrahydrodipicolinate reductase
VIPLVVVGAAGRMGRAIAEAATGAGDVTVRACVDREVPNGTTAGPVWGTDLASVARLGDVVVEFSSPAGAAAAARLCAERGLPLVSGTTALDGAQEAAIRDAAARVAVVRAANFSLGVLALKQALDAVLAPLAGWDVEIIERHHRGKADAPSGTAIDLARRAREAHGWGEETLRHGRQGKGGPRNDAEIGVHSLRGGTWIGDHTVVLAGRGEWIELRHVAQDRGAFAHGVLSAARFVVSAAPGFYTLNDVVRAAVTNV